MKTRVFLAASICLFVACLPFDSFCVNGECGQWPSYGVLLVGPIGLFSLTVGNLIWVANPILFVAWYACYIREKSRAWVLSIAALSIGASFLLVKDVVTNEAGIPFPVTGYRAGYWLWLASMILACVSALSLSRQRADMRPPVHPSET